MLNRLPSVGVLTERNKKIINTTTYYLLAGEDTGQG